MVYKSIWLPKEIKTTKTFLLKRFKPSRTHIAERQTPTSRESNLLSLSSEKINLGSVMPTLAMKGLSTSELTTSKSY